VLKVSIGLRLFIPQARGKDLCRVDAIGRFYDARAKGFALSGTARRRLGNDK